MSASTAPARRSPGAIVVAVVSAAAHVVVGIYYLAGGLVVPGQVLYPLWALWLALGVWLIRLAVRGSWWTPVVPLLAAAVLVGTVVVGGSVFDWRA